MHKNARLTVKGREVLIGRLQAGQRVAEVAQAMGLSETTVRKWWRRFRDGEGLHDRSSRPHSSPRAIGAERRAQIEALRRQRRCGRLIAQTLGLSVATVSRVLRRAGLSRWRELEPQAPVVRYERQAPVELVHIDTKKLGRIGAPGHRVTGHRTHRSRGIGWEFAHVAIDDHSRTSLVTMAEDERQDSAVAFLEQVVAHYRACGIKVQRVMTDNGSAYQSKAFAAACRRLGVRHLRTRPYTPQTNGKAERFIQTCLREWAYAASYATSQQRREALRDWLHHYNCHRPHSALGGRPPISRLPFGQNNLLKLHS
ncbi:IS481 family transposase [Silanimonas lenta]|jgi:transposase InsO family protein|uniref:IS481 family transposase n=1 Tax=Silanimonas lenta TaxID=265429 RepID=UPI00041DF63D|nr:IS481 family transposase [Silanimonas lenta]